MLRLAIIGLGWWGRQLVRELKGSDCLRVTQGVDPDPSAAAFARDNGFALAAGFDDVIADPDVDAVAIVTPHSLHHDQVLAAIGAGKQVYCEKPLAMTAASATAMLDACAERGFVLGVGHERRYEPAYEKAQHLAKSGALGRLIAIDANISHDQFLKLDRSNWRLSRQHAPAGLMTGPGIHLTDLFVTIAGPASRVRARAACRIFEAPAEDFMSAQIEFASGVFGSVTTISSTPFYGRFTVYGEHGWVEVTEAGNVDSGLPTTVRTKLASSAMETESFLPRNTAAVNLDAWADAIAGRQPYRFTRDEILANIKIFEAIVASCDKQGEVIAV